MLSFSIVSLSISRVFFIDFYKNTFVNIQVRITKRREFDETNLFSISSTLSVLLIGTKRKIIDSRHRHCFWKSSRERDTRRIIFYSLMLITLSTPLLIRQYQKYHRHSEMSTIQVLCTKMWLRWMRSKNKKKRFQLTIVKLFHRVIIKAAFSKRWPLLLTILTQLSDRPPCHRERSFLHYRIRIEGIWRAQRPEVQCFLGGQKSTTCGKKIWGKSSIMVCIYFLVCGKRLCRLSFETLINFSGERRTRHARAIETFKAL